MSRRRLTGIAAMSAVTLATAGIAGTTAAAEDCDGPECTPGITELRALIEAAGGGELPDQALVQMLAMYKSIGVDPAMLIGMADPEQLAIFLKLGDDGGSGELDPQTAIFMKVFLEAADGGGLSEEGLEDALAELILGEIGLDGEAFPFYKVIDAGDEAFVELGDPLEAVEAALANAAAQGAIDPATLQIIRELLRN